MVNPVLKKLRSSRISAGEIATLLEKHIGSDSNEANCVQALEALQRIPNQQIRNAVLVLNLLLKSDAPPSERIRAVIGQIRSDVWD